MRKKAYLAGPISGLSFGAATDWREYAKAKLDHAGIDGYSPMRAKQYLKDHADLTHNNLQFGCHELAPILSSDRGIMTRDRWDCITADLILVNLLGAKTVSIGTVMEMAIGDILRKPLVVCIEKEGNPHDHSMLKEAWGFRCESLEQGLVICQAILNP